MTPYKKQNIKQSNILKVTTIPGCILFEGSFGLLEEKRMTSRLSGGLPAGGGGAAAPAPGAGTLPRSSSIEGLR